MFQVNLAHHFPTASIVWSLVIALVGVALTVVSVVFLYPVWSNRSWSLGRRLRHTFIVLILVDLVLLLHSYNLIGFNYY